MCIQGILTPHCLGPVLQTVQIVPVRPDSVALWRGQTAQTCWLSFGPGHVWRTQSSVGEKREQYIRTGKTINILPDFFGCKLSKYVVYVVATYDLTRQSTSVLCLKILSCSVFVWPVKLLKTQRGKARQAGWADCRAGWEWRSVRGCKRFSRNQASKTPGLGSAERKALWTPEERKQYTLMNIK